MRFSPFFAATLFQVFLAQGLKASPSSVIVAKDAMQAQVVLDPDGKVYVVFIQKGNICVSTSADKGMTFGEPVVAIDAQGHAAGGMQRGPRIGVDAKKTITVTAWIVLDPAEREHKYPTGELCLVSSRDGGKTWSKPLQVNDVPKKAPEALHWMSVEPNGTVHLAWLARRSRPGDGQDIYYAKVSEGKVGKNVKIASEVCECCAPGLGVDAMGNPLIAYREGGTKPSREIFAVRGSEKGESFGKPIQINRESTNISTCPMSAPAVAVSPDGRKVAIAWMDERVTQGDQDVYWAVTYGPKFSRDAIISDITDGSQNHPALAVDGVGKFWAAWEDKRSGEQVIYARSSLNDAKDEKVSSEADGKVSLPSIHAAGKLVGVVYEASKDGEKQVMFRLVAN